MSDIATIWVPSLSRADWIADALAPATAADLATSVLISLFTDRLANADDVIPDGTTNRRGWWGDDPDHLSGSRLWLLDRAKRTNATVGLVQTYIAEALQWLLDDGVASAVNIQAAWAGLSTMTAAITISRAGQPPVTLNYAWAWQGV